MKQIHICTYLYIHTNVSSMNIHKLYVSIYKHQKNHIYTYTYIPSINEPYSDIRDPGTASEILYIAL